MLSEGLLCMMIGALLGLAVAAPALLQSGAGLHDEIGVPVTLVMPWETLAAVAGVCGLLATVAAAWSLRRARTMAG